MKRRMIIRRENGVAAIEFAIVLPFLVVLALGICEFGILFYNKQVITNASREGARAGTTREVGTSEISDIVEKYCENRLITFGDAEPGTEFPHGNNLNLLFQDDFSVKVTYEYQFLLSSLFGLGPTQTISAVTLMQMEAAES